MPAPKTNITAAQRKPNLPAAIDALQEAVRRLVKPGDRYLNNTWISVPSLYQQLRSSVGGVRMAGSAGVAQSCPPVWVDAEEQLRNIDTMVQIWTSASGPARCGGLTGSADELLPILAGKHWTVEQAHHVRALAKIISEWCDDIVTLLNEAHTKYIDAPCPACGESVVYHQNSAGENVRQPALAVIAETGCTCQSCGYYWAPQRYVDLARQLGIVPEWVLQ